MTKNRLAFSNLNLKYTFAFSKYLFILKSFLYFYKHPKGEIKFILNLSSAQELRRKEHHVYKNFGHPFN